MPWACFENLLSFCYHFVIIDFQNPKNPVITARKEQGKRESNPERTYKNPVNTGIPRVFACYRCYHSKERGNCVAWFPFQEGAKMDKDLQEIIDELEGMQYSILLWIRKEKDKTKKQLLINYDNNIEKLIDKVYELDK